MKYIKKENRIYTDNKGILEVIQPFNFLRGKQNDGVMMGLAKDNKGNKFEIYPSECGLGNNCFCYSTAKDLLDAGS